MKPTSTAQVSAAVLVVALTHGGCGAETEPGQLGDLTDGGGVSASSSGGGGSSSSGSSGGGSSSSGGSSGSNSGSSSGGADSGMLPGTIELGQAFPVSANSPANLSAVFGQAATNGGCVLAQAGGCVFYGCTPGTASYGDSAGTLKVTGSGGTFTGPATMTPSPRGFYESGSSSYLSAGQTLTVTASGGVVPAFGPQSVVLPPIPTLTAPTEFDIPTKSDLQVTWTGGQMGATFELKGGSGGQGSFACSWDATLGQGVVASSILVGLETNVGGGISYGQHATTSFAAGRYQIDLEALAFSTTTVVFQ